MRFICLHTDKPSSNKNIYPRTVIQDNVNRLKETIDKRALMGELGMPQNSVIYFSRVSHVITDLHLNEDALEVSIEVLDTPEGKILKQLLETDSVAFRTRGVGNGTEDSDGNFIVDENFKLITIDAVNKEEAATWE